jgi:uncharacterized protein YbcV (DUF1398 family)
MRRRSSGLCAFDQAGKSTFPEFLAASSLAGVVRYDVDFAARTVTYCGCNGEEYIEAYPFVETPDKHKLVCS